MDIGVNVLNSIHLFKRFRIPHRPARFLILVVFEAHDSSFYTQKFSGFRNLANARINGANGTTFSMCFDTI